MFYDRGHSSTSFFYSLLFHLEKNPDNRYYNLNNRRKGNH